MCIKSGNVVHNHFADIGKMVVIGSGAEREIDEKLRRENTMCKTVAGEVNYRVGKKVRQTILFQNLEFYGIEMYTYIYIAMRKCYAKAKENFLKGLCNMRNCHTIRQDRLNLLYYIKIDTSSTYSNREVGYNNEIQKNRPTFQHAVPLYDITKCEKNH